MREAEAAPGEGGAVLACPAVATGGAQEPECWQHQGAVEPVEADPGLGLGDFWFQMWFPEESVVGKSVKRKGLSVWWEERHQNATTRD